MPIDPWTAVGFVAQFFFFLRFVAQWISSEVAGRSLIPPSFWFFSILGGLGLLIYAIHKRDPVFIAGQAAGLVIYFRNVFLMQGEKAAPNSVREHSNKAA